MFFFPLSLFKPPWITCLAMEIRFCWEYVPSFLPGYIPCSHQTPLPSCLWMWLILDCFCHSHMLFKCVKFRTQNDILSLHNQIPNAFHTINFSMITLEHFSHENCVAQIFYTCERHCSFFRFPWQWFSFSKT